MKLSIEMFPVHGKSPVPMARSFMQAGATHISMTYGAGGSSSVCGAEHVLAMADYAIPTAAHITIGRQSREATDELLQVWRDAGIRRFVALRGDGDGPEKRFMPRQDGYQSSIELIKKISDLGATQISVAAYPNGHPDSRGPDADIDYLKAKQDAGATEAITQFFFDSAAYLRFRDRCVSRGVSMEIVPGALPVFNYGKVAEFARKCHEPIPAWLAERFRGLDSHPDLRRQVAVSTVVSLCETLEAHGAGRVHVYACNRVDTALAIAHMLNHPVPGLSAA